MTSGMTKEEAKVLDPWNAAYNGSSSPSRMLGKEGEGKDLGRSQGRGGGRRPMCDHEDG